MSWTTPQNWPVGLTVTAAMMNAQIRDNFNLLATAIDTTNGKFQAINATYVKSLAGLVQVQNSQVGTQVNSGTGETTLFTYSLPGGTLANAGQAVRITAAGGAANNANVKTLKMYFGTDVRGVTGNVPASSLGNWIWETLVARLTGTTQTRWDRYLIGPNGAADTNGYGDGGTPSQTLSGALTLKVTGTGGASSDLSASLWLVEILQQ